MGAVGSVVGDDLGLRVVLCFVGAELSQEHLVVEQLDQSLFQRNLHLLHKFALGLVGGGPPVNLRYGHRLPVVVEALDDEVDKRTADAVVLCVDGHNLGAELHNVSREPLNLLEGRQVVPEIEEHHFTPLVESRDRRIVTTTSGSEVDTDVHLVEGCRCDVGYCVLVEEGEDHSVIVKPFTENLALELVRRKNPPVLLHHVLADETAGVPVVPVNGHHLATAR